MRHLQLSTTCCFASQTALAVRAFAGACACTRINTVNHKHKSHPEILRHTNTTTFGRPSLSFVWLEARELNLERARRWKSIKGSESRGGEGDAPLSSCTVHSNWALKRSSDPLKTTEMKNKSEEGSWEEQSWKRWEVKKENPKTVMLFLSISFVNIKLICEGCPAGWRSRFLCFLSLC